MYTYSHIDNRYVIVYCCISIYYHMTYVYMHIFTTVNIFHLKIKLYEITYYIISYNIYDNELLLLLFGSAVMRIVNTINNKQILPQ